jgi:spermidine/putrescine transport system permease protein
MIDAFSLWPKWVSRGGAMLGWSILLFLYLPIITLIAYSFSDSRSFTFPITGWTLAWYAKLAANEDLLRSVRNSFIVAGGTVPLSLVLGVPAAYALARAQFPGRALVERALMLPLMIPGLITGLSILLLLKRAGFELSLLSVVLGHTVAWLPIVVTQVFARLRRFDPTFEEASIDLGANPFQTFIRITLPNISNAILGSALLVFILSFDEIAITFLLTGTENTLPMLVWAMLRRGVTPEICAIATITVVSSTLLVLIGVRFLGNQEKS